MLCCDDQEYQARCSDKWSGSFVLRRSLSLGGVTACSVEARAGVALVSNIPAPPLSLIICALYLGNSVIPIEGVIAPPRIRLISRPDNLVPEYPQTQLQYLEATCLVWPGRRDDAWGHSLIFIKTVTQRSLQSGPHLSLISE